MSSLREVIEPYVEAGYIKKTRHPSLLCDIYCYSKNGMYEYANKTWPFEMLIARGLVLDDDSNIVMRGMPKFFNVEQVDPRDYDWEDARITEKMDGTMILVSHDMASGNLIVSTKGSFDNEFVDVAWDCLDAKMIRRFANYPNLTFIFELVHKVSANIVSYAGVEKGLYYIGTMENKESSSFYPAPVEPVIPRKTVRSVPLKEIYAEWTRPAHEQEGYVAFFPRTNQFLKLKNPAYFHAASIREHFTYRKVYEMHMDNTLDDRYLDMLDTETREDALSFLHDVNVKLRDYRARARQIAYDAYWSSSDEAKRAKRVKEECEKQGINPSVVFAKLNNKSEAYKKSLKKAIWTEVKEWDTR